MSVENRRISEVAIALPGVPGRNASEADRSPAEQPAADWLLARADRTRSFHGSWREWIAETAGFPVGILESHREGPCAAVATINAPGPGSWARARPVHLVAAMDHLRLAPPEALDLGAEEAAALLESLNAHLAGSGLRLHAVQPDEWLLEYAREIDCVNAAPDLAADSNLREFQPQGADAGEIRRLQTELQMLLHEHPVNEARARLGRPAANSLWLWGFGTVPVTGRRALPRLYSDDPWLLGLWRLHGAFVAAPGDFDPRIAQAEGLNVLAPTREHRAAVARGDASGDVALAEKYLGPLRAALTTGALQRLRILCGSMEFEVTPRARWRFWRRMPELAGGQT